MRASVPGPAGPLQKIQSEMAPGKLFSRAPAMAALCRLNSWCAVRQDVAEIAGKQQQDEEFQLQEPDQIPLLL